MSDTQSNSAKALRSHPWRLLLLLRGSLRSHGCEGWCTQQRKEAEDLKPIVRPRIRPMILWTLVAQFYTRPK